MKTFERSEFLDLCRETIEEYTQAMRETAARVGLSCDFDKEYLTDSEEYRECLNQSSLICSRERHCRRPTPQYL